MLLLRADVCRLVEFATALGFDPERAQGVTLAALATLLHLMVQKQPMAAGGRLG